MITDNFLGSNKNLCQDANFSWGAVINNICDFLLEWLDRMFQIIAQKGLRRNMQGICNADQGLDA